MAEVRERVVPTEEARRDIAPNEVLRAVRSVSLGIALGLVLSWLARRAERGR